MKKLLALALLLGSSALFVSSAEAKSANASASINPANASYANIEQPRRQWNRRMRVVVTTRNVRRGRLLYRETYRTTYFANGRVNRRLISRVIIRRY